MPFEQGATGNPTGRPKSTKMFKDALTLAIKRAEADKTMLAHVAEALVAKAMLGDVPAIKEIADRLDGKSAQPITGDDEAPLNIIHEIRRTIVRPNDTRT